MGQEFGTFQVQNLSIGQQVLQTEAVLLQLYGLLGQTTQMTGSRMELKTVTCVSGKGPKKKIK